MTMTLTEPAGSTETLSSLDPTREPAPFEAAPFAAAELISEAERLLTAPATDRRALGRRLAWGVVGLGALGVGPELALYLAEAVPFSAADLWRFVGSALALPMAAALTVSLPLPGLLILLGMQGDRAEPRACLHALSLAYYRVGLVALGLTPILLLYAFTGARYGVLVGAAGGYFVAGGVALALLVGDLYRCLPEARGASRVLLFAWACFVCLVSVYFFVKLEPFAWR